MRLRSLLRLGRPERPPDEALARVKAWAAAALACEASLVVNEIVCRDPSCPGTETVILIMAPGRKTWAAKVTKAVEEVTEEDVRAALACGGA